MASEYEIFEFLEADNIEDKTKRKRSRKQLREDSNPFDLNEAEFIKRYRLTKELVHNLCDELRPHMKSPKKSTDLSVETKVLIALSFYGTGSYQRSTGNNEGHFVAQQTASSAISQVTMCLNSLEMQQKYIKFPVTDEEQNVVKTKFFDTFQIPGVLGCIGCCQVAIKRPVGDEERYYCGKRYHTLNVQLICDADMHIMSVDATHGGATCNSDIWATHPLRSHLDDLSNTSDTWLLGDSGYQLTKHMMTPILDAATDSPEAHYTTLHVRARSTLKRTIGLLKSCFRCLLIQKVLHYSPEVAGQIVNACVLLHNICNKVNVPVEPLSNDDVILEDQLQSQDVNELSSGDNMGLQQGLATRKSLVQRLRESRTSRL